MSVVGRAAKQGVQLVELAALAFPAHPAAFDLVPATPPVEEQEAGPAAGGLAVAGIQAVDRRRGRRREARRRPGRFSLGASSQSDSSANRRSPSGVAEVVDLEAAHLLLDARLAGEQRGYHDQRPEGRRHASGQLEPRQPPGAEHVGHDPVDQRDRQVRGGGEGQDREHEQAGPRIPPPLHEDSGTARIRAVTSASVPR